MSKTNSKKQTRIWIVSVAVLIAAVTIVYFGIFFEGGSDALKGTLGRFTGADQQELPFESDDEVAEFLRTAKVVSSKRIGEGINNPLKVLLEQDGVQMHAVFRDVDVQKAKVKLGNRMHFNFRDDAIYEVAAYELSRMLEIDSVPPAVIRRLDRTKGTLQVFIENAMTEKSRLAKDAKPEDRGRWLHQQYVMRVFDNLIYNDDRNQGNILYDGTWKLWMIDHTRAFRRYKELKSPNIVLKCESGLWEKLQTLDGDEVKARLKPYLTGSEIKAIMKRRDLLVERIQGLIDKQGPEVVLFELPAEEPTVQTVAVAAE